MMSYFKCPECGEEDRVILVEYNLMGKSFVKGVKNTDHGLQIECDGEPDYDAQDDYSVNYVCGECGNEIAGNTDEMVALMEEFAKNNPS
jgi:predicted RNA-binding Zn-ribbon protein involved in translation (DUF1610 family)